LTDRELLSCHAEVKALQNKLGTSYKDASHCLYMAEVEKLEQQDITLKTCDFEGKSGVQYEIILKQVCRNSNQTIPGDQ
jgi:hypothetical protein